MNKIILDNYESITTTGHSSKGNQLKCVIRQIKRGLFCQIKTGLSEYLTMV